MSHEFDRGKMTAKSWHEEEQICEMLSAYDLIAAGRESGAFPESLRKCDLFTQDGLLSEMYAMVASYQGHPDRIVGEVRGRYGALDPSDWNSLIHAAVDAGAKPTGAFSLRGGRRIVATFEIGRSSGIVDHLVLADAFDGSLKLTGGMTSTRVVCANTLRAAMASDGKGMAKLRHTSSIGDKVASLREAIQGALQGGNDVRTLYASAENTRLIYDPFAKAFDQFFPRAPEGASQHAVTRALNEREDAYRAMRNPVNKVDDGFNLATIWNGATYLVDREGDGSQRECRGGAESVDSLLFGARAARVAEIENIVRTMVEVVRPDGSVDAMEMSEALRSGIAPDQASALDWMLDA